MAFKELREKIAYINLLTSDPMPITRFGPKLLGDKLGGSSDFQKLYQNTLQRPVSVQIEAVFTTPGGSIRLTSEPNGTDSYQIDELANTAGGKNVSNTIILDAQEFLFIQNSNTLFPLTSTDTFRVVIFDPMKHIEKDF